VPDSVKIDVSAGILVEVGDKGAGGGASPAAANETLLRGGIVLKCSEPGAEQSSRLESVNEVRPRNLVVDQLERNQSYGRQKSRMLGCDERVVLSFLDAVRDSRIRV
jgi:hypothetical protein